MLTRREFLTAGAVLAGGLGTLGVRALAQTPVEGDGAGLSDFRTADGRLLEYFTGGPEGNLTVVLHHGTPDSAVGYISWVEAARAAGLRVLAYSRPGYGRSARVAGRDVAHAARDTAVLLDHLGVETFVTVGGSGGGPHALACAALLPKRCRGVATLGGVGPYGVEDLDFLAGMGPENVEEFEAVLRGTDTVAAFIAERYTGLRTITGDQVKEAFGGLASEPDKAALTGEFVNNVARAMRWGLQDGFGGWIDDDIAFTKPWGFDLKSIRVPVSVWQGKQDRFVPASHGKWLAKHVPGARLRVEARHGHISLATAHRTAILQELSASAHARQ